MLHLALFYITSHCWSLVCILHNNRLRHGRPLIHLVFAVFLCFLDMFLTVWFAGRCAYFVMVKWTHSTYIHQTGKDDRWAVRFRLSWKRLAFKPCDWIRCYFALFDWFKGEAIWKPLYYKFPTHTKTVLCQINPLKKLNLNHSLNVPHAGKIKTLSTARFQCKGEWNYHSLSSKLSPISSFNLRMRLSSTAVHAYLLLTWHFLMTF
jgi:hypothetical protein